MMSALTGTALDALLADWGGRGFVDFKAALTEALVAEIAPLRSEILKFNADPAMLDQLLAEGAVKEAIARPVLSASMIFSAFCAPPSIACSRKSGLRSMRALSLALPLMPED